MIDLDGFRLNVGIILVNHKAQVFWAKRIGQDAWQFPQGGINLDENPQIALYRELDEEIGLHQSDVEVIGCTYGWLRYRLPKRFIRWRVKPLCIGQKQKWFLLRLKSNDDKVCLDKATKPEFDEWRWVDYWHPLKEVVAFKKDVYKQALNELAPFVNKNLIINK